MTDILKELGFTEISITPSLVQKRTNCEDIDLFSHSLRIGDCTFLFYSEHYNKLSISVSSHLVGNRKGKAGGGFDEYKSVMIPKEITTETLIQIVKALV